MCWTKAAWRELTSSCEREGTAGRGPEIERVSGVSGLDFEIGSLLLPPTDDPSLLTVLGRGGRLLAKY